jgi:hypothetical protein
MTHYAEQRYGELALALNIGGVALAVVIGLLAKHWHQNGGVPAYLVFLSFQAAALVLGIIARRTPPGKAAAITAGVLTVSSLTLMA